MVQDQFAKNANTRLVARVPSRVTSHVARAERGTADCARRSQVALVFFLVFFFFVRFVGFFSGFLYSLVSSVLLFFCPVFSFFYVGFFRLCSVFSLPFRFFSSKFVYTRVKSLYIYMYIFCTYIKFVYARVQSLYTHIQTLYTHVYKVCICTCIKFIYMFIFLYTYIKFVYSRIQSLYTSCIKFIYICTYTKFVYACIQSLYTYKCTYIATYPMHTSIQLHSCTRSFRALRSRSYG